MAAGVPKSRAFECEACVAAVVAGRNDIRTTFTLLLWPDDPLPSACPICGARIDGIEPLPSRINIGGSPLNRSMEATYRGLENASAARAEEAASMLGVPVSEVSAIKTTNMKDNLREGDTSAVMPSVPDARQVPQLGQHFVGAQQALAAARTGPGAGSGIAAVTEIKSMHNVRAARMQAIGRVNKD